MEDRHGKALYQCRRCAKIYSHLGTIDRHSCHPAEDHTDGGDDENGGEDNDEDDEHQRQPPKVPKKYM
jgi:hypothetical protein